MGIERVGVPQDCLSDFPTLTVFTESNLVISKRGQ